MPAAGEGSGAGPPGGSGSAVGRLADSEPGSAVGLPTGFGLAAGSGAGSAAEPVLEVRGAGVSFGSATALAGVDLAVGAGETVAILGPSGCGKSTLLRAVAGLQPLDRGRVLWDGADLAGVPVHRRDFGLMFQDHALFTHRDVAANVAFGLRMQGAPAEARRARAAEMLELVGLGGFGPRSVDTLSGGEAQRVALARALAPEPRLLMLDEPLGSLDRRRRDELAIELRRVLSEVGVTVLHVTHDHDEAFAVADRVAVMLAGRMARIGAPAEVWRDPRRSDVARFLGHANVVEVGPGGAVPWGRLDAEPGRAVIRSDAFRRLSGDEPAAGAPIRGPVGPGSASGSTWRPDGAEAPASTVEVVVADTRFRGDRFELRVCTDPGGVELVVLDPEPADVGRRLAYAIDPAAIAPVD